MEKEVVSVDVAKEFLTVLAYCDSSFIDNIPASILKDLNDLAADSVKDFYIDEDRELIEQNISQECRELIGKMYFMYMTDSKAKEEIFNALLNN